MELGFVVEPQTLFIAMTVQSIVHVFRISEEALFYQQVEMLE